MDFILFDEILYFIISLRNFLRIFRNFSRCVQLSVVVYRRLIYNIGGIIGYASQRLGYLSQILIGGKSDFV